MLSKYTEGLIDLIFPPSCPLCSNRSLPHEVMCRPCQSKIVFNQPPFCVKCSRHMGSRPLSNLCRDCRTTKPAFDFAWSACLYEGPLIDLLHAYKFHHKTSLRYPFVSLLTTFIDKYSLDISQFDYLVPMPLHPTRLRERGYNQSFLLAQSLSIHYSLPLRTNILQRRRHTEHQSLLRSKERWTNIDEAFRINAVQDVKNKKIGVVDDLLTTGATASQAARALKENGAKSVGIITLAVTL